MKNIFSWNILLAVAWVALTGPVTTANLIVGFLVGYVALTIVHPSLRRKKGLGKLRLWISFLLFFLWEVVLSNLRVAAAVIRPQSSLRPGVIAIPLEARTDIEITMLANCITLTPGTLSVDVSRDRKLLFVHALQIHDPEALRQEIKQGLERRVLEVLR